MLDLRRASSQQRRGASRHFDADAPYAAGATASTRGCRCLLRPPGLVCLFLLPLAAVPVAANVPTGSCPSPVSVESVMPEPDPDSETASTLRAARLLASTDDQSEALDAIHSLLREAVTHAERDYGESDRRLVVPLMAIGTFHFNVAQGDSGRRAHSRAAGILMRHGEDGRLAATAPLGFIARYQLSSSRMTSKGISRFEEILAIFDAHPCPDAQEHFTAARDLGDAYTIGKRPALAAEVYRRAWEMLESNDGCAAAERAFNAPKQLRMRFAYPVADDRPWTADEISRRHLELEFTVTAAGRVVDLAVPEYDAPNRTKLACKRAIRQAIYRPRLLDGRPVETSGFRLRVSFEPGRSRASSRTRPDAPPLVYPMRAVITEVPRSMGSEQTKCRHGRLGEP